MPILPSGRNVDIMSERARFHAARLNLRVTERTPHHQLYRLVDILVAGHDEGHGQEFGFSGYTLADARWLNRWSEVDRRRFLDWIREPAQVRIIEMARRRLLAEEGVPRERVYAYPARLYSMLERRLAALPLQRADSTQWRRTLLNLKHDGLRREELDWSGILRFLAGQPPGTLLEKAALLAAIDFSTVRPRLTTALGHADGCALPFREVAQRLPGYHLRMAGYPLADADVGVVRRRSLDPDYRIGVIWPGGRSLAGAGRPCWFALGPFGRPVARGDRSGRLLFASEREAWEAVSHHALRYQRLRRGLVHRARYEHLSLHGGEEYREWLVTLPHFQRSHFNGHFPDRNVLLHIRSKLRRTLDGRRMLFIEEIQSDWHQAAARCVLRGEIPRAPFRREWAALALKLMLLHVVEKGLDGIAWADGPVHHLRYDRVMPPLARLYDQELAEILERLAAPWGARVGRGEFATRDPWLRAARSKSNWKVEGGAGRFATRARYNKHEAMALIERHSRPVVLSLPTLLLPEPMARHIAEHGLPLFGERHADAGVVARIPNV